jgi:dihydroorotate dehydrogenase electron transfer subunit
MTSPVMPPVRQWRSTLSTWSSAAAPPSWLANGLESCSPSGARSATASALPSETGPVGFVAGGIGQTPFLALARWWRGDAAYGCEPPLPGPFVREARLYYGVRTAAFFAGLDDFQAAGLDVRTATDDGSHGHHGFVTDRLAADLEGGWKPVKLVGCGPFPMLAALARLAERYAIACDLSLENQMACGFGACFSCVAPIRQPDGSTDLKRVCVEGPIFNARDVVF